MESEIGQLREELQRKTWFAFDLDDTLHEFRKASGKAVEATLQHISNAFVGRHHLPLAKLQAEYTQVLKQKTSHAFADGKTSHDYRRDRFVTVLGNLGVENATTLDMQGFLSTYEDTLAASLELKCGALELFKSLKSMGKKIVVITEGPQDAQVRTVKALGLEPFVDFLATTNHFLASKVNSLYEKVLSKLKVTPDAIVMVGDNFERDMEPAMKLGILCIHYAERDPPSLQTRPIKVKSLKDLGDYVLT